MNVVRACAFGVSAAIHLLGFSIMTLILASESQRGLTTDRPEAISAFIVAAPEDVRFPGLHPVSSAPEDQLDDFSGLSSSLFIGTFKFDIARIAEHAEVLFPFLTPGVSLEHFALAPEGDSQEHLG